MPNDLEITGKNVFATEACNKNFWEKILPSEENFQLQSWGGEKEILKDGSDLLTSAQAINSQKDDFHQIQASLSKVYLVLL